MMAFKYDAPASDEDRSPCLKGQRREVSEVSKIRVSCEMLEIGLDKSLRYRPAKYEIENEAYVVVRAIGLREFRQLIPLVRHALLLLGSFDAERLYPE